MAELCYGDVLPERGGAGIRGWWFRGRAEKPSLEKYSNRFSLSDLKFVGFREALASAKYFKSLASHPRRVAQKVEKPRVSYVPAKNCIVLAVKARLERIPNAVTAFEG